MLDMPRICSLMNNPVDSGGFHMTVNSTPNKMFIICISTLISIDTALQNTVRFRSGILINSPPPSHAGDLYIDWYLFLSNFDLKHD